MSEVQSLISNFKGNLFNPKISEKELVGRYLSFGTPIFFGTMKICISI